MNQKQLKNWFKDKLNSIFVRKEPPYKDIIQIERYYLIYHLKDLIYEFGPMNRNKMKYLDYINEYIKAIDLNTSKDKIKVKKLGTERDVGLFCNTFIDSIQQVAEQFINELYPENIRNYFKKQDNGIFDCVYSVLKRRYIKTSRFRHEVNKFLGYDYYWGPF